MKALYTSLTIVVLIFLFAQNVNAQAARQGANSVQPVVTDRVVRIGENQFHYQYQGTGSPTVVMDAGLCQASDTWGNVPLHIATFTRVFVYDRVGLGRSSSLLSQDDKQSANPRNMRTSKQIVQELHELLGKAAMPAPYVLVGHSFGGVNMLLFASQYPSEVAGIVLVDSSHEDGYSRYITLMPPEHREGQTRTYHGGNCERVDLAASSAQLRFAAPLPRVPLTVLTALGNVEPERMSAHIELQADLARRAPNGIHRIVERSRHFIQKDRPDVVIEAIRNVVNPAPIPLPTGEDLKLARFLYISIPTEVALSGAALGLSGLVGWRWRRRKRSSKAQLNRAQRRQVSRKEKV